MLSAAEDEDEGVGGEDDEDDNVQIHIDRAGAIAPKHSNKKGASLKKAAPTAAWQDDDDADMQVDLNATDRLKKLNKDIGTAQARDKKGRKNISGAELSLLLKERFETKQLEWAQVAEGQEEDPDLAILRQGGTMVEGSHRGEKGSSSLNGNMNSSRDGPLPAGKINLARLVDANAAAPSDDVISAVAFHSAGSLLLTGGYDRHLRFFRIDGEKNEKILTVKFADMSISKAAYLGSSAEVVLGGRKPFFYGYDTESGRVSKYPGLMGHGLKSHEHLIMSPEGTKLAFLGASGYIHVACGRQKTWMMDLKMNSAARAGAFLNEQTLVTSGLDADVYTWDLRMQGRCLSRFKHEDGTCSSAIACAPRGGALDRAHGTQQCVSIGAESGAVSLFTGALPTGTNRPVQSPKSLLHLTTQITTLEFHPAGDFMALASSSKTDQMRLVHVASGTVFSNWPTAKTPLRKVQTVAFSPGGGLMAVGNDRGRVLLYRLNHYSS